MKKEKTFKEKTFEEELRENIKKEYQELHPVVLEILKKGMLEGQKRREDGPGIDKIQLDAAKVGAMISQYYTEQIIGKPLSRSEITGKNGAPLKVSLNFVLEKEPDPENGVQTIIDNQTHYDGVPDQYDGAPDQQDSQDT